MTRESEIRKDVFDLPDQVDRLGKLQALIEERISLHVLNDHLEGALLSHDPQARVQAILAVRSAQSEAVRTLSHGARMLNPEFQRLQMLADATLSKSDQAMGAVAGVKEVAIESAEGMWDALKAANTLLNASFGDRQAQMEVAAAGKTLMALAQPETLMKVIDIAIDQHRDQVASAYESGDAHELGRLGVKTLADLPLPGPAAIGIIRKVDEISNATSTAIKLDKQLNSLDSAQMDPTATLTIRNVETLRTTPVLRDTFRPEGFREFKSAIIQWMQDYADQKFSFLENSREKVMAMKPVELPPVSSEEVARIAAAYEAQRAEGRQVFDVVHVINPGQAIDETRKINCFNCALATAATQYGNPASALPVTFGRGLDQKEMTQYFKADAIPDLGYVKVLDEMLKLPDNTLGYISSRDFAGAHIFNLAKVDGKVHVEDHQVTPPLKISISSENYYNVLAKISAQLDSRSQGLPSTPFNGFVDDVKFSITVPDLAKGIAPDRVTREQMEITRETLHGYPKNKSIPESVLMQADRDASTLGSALADSFKDSPIEKADFSEAAKSFLKEPPDVALKKYPELEWAFNVMEKIDQRAEATGKTAEERLEIAIQARELVARDMSSGEFPGVRQEIGTKEPEVAHVRASELER